MSAPMQNITLDMVRRNVSRRAVYLGEGDSKGTLLVVSLTEDGRPYDVTDLVVTLSIPIDNATYVFDGTASGNVAQFTIDESVFGSISGRFRGAYVTVSSDDFTSSSQRFDVEILPSTKKSSEGEGEPDGEPDVDPEDMEETEFLTDEEIDSMFGRP